MGKGEDYINSDGKRVFPIQMVIGKRGRHVSWYIESKTQALLYLKGYLN